MGTSRRGAVNEEPLQGLTCAVSRAGKWGGSSEQELEAEPWSRNTVGGWHLVSRQDLRALEEVHAGCVP